MGKPPFRIRRITDASPKSILVDRHSGGVFGGQAQLESVAKRRGGLGRISGTGSMSSEIVEYPTYGFSISTSGTWSGPPVNLRPGLWAIDLMVGASFDDLAFDPEDRESRYREFVGQLRVDNGLSGGPKYVSARAGRHEGGSYDSQSAGSVALTTVARMVGSGGSFSPVFQLGGSSYGGWTWTFQAFGQAEYLGP